VSLDHHHVTQNEQVGHSILVHFGELGLKGRNQPMFRRQLRRNIRLKLRSLGVDWPVDDAVGLFTIEAPEGETEKRIRAVLEGLRDVFGIVWLTWARRLRPHRFTPESRAADIAELTSQLLSLARAQYQPNKSFCVRVNRGNKFLAFTSPELAAQLGQVIRDQTDWKDVELNRPDVTFHLDVRCAATYVFGEKLKGPGGLPVGTSGRVLALLSGGIDSPVAAYLMARRGCRLDFIHFTAAAPHQEEQQKVWRLANQLSRYTIGSRLFVVPYVYFDLALMREKVDYELILFRRFMVRVAQVLADRLRARALISGDTLSQVASQTMSNLVSTSRAAELPIFRPLIAYDKEETIALAQKIGTYELSIEPYKDCCALISGNPKTRSRHERLLVLEKRAFPDYAGLIERTLADAICLQIGRGEADDSADGSFSGG
jgi:thiamine biosynthesis protein ThiI